MGLFDLFSRAVDWAADQIQTSTGEKDRRQFVDQLKSLASEFKERVSAAVQELNQVISSFNQQIQKLNSLRLSKVKSNIDELFRFLSQFGNCKPAEKYADEEEMLIAEFPQRDYDNITNYIVDVDWSKDEVFLNSFFLTPIGVKIKTRGQNLSMQEHLHEFRLQLDETLRELEVRQFQTEQDLKICGLYISNVEFISEFISRRILPELELVEAFFQAEKVKDQVISGQDLGLISFSYQITVIKDTIYDRHYQFVKNALMFYVLSCKIYHTPVLTNLLRAATSGEDITRLEEEKRMLLGQAELVSQAMAVKRGE